MVTHRVIVVVFTVLTGSGLILAQQPAPDAQPAPPPATAAGPASPQWRGLSVKEKLEYDGRHLFDADNLVFAGIGAAFDQLRDRPGQWDQGWGPFSERYASHLGSYLIQRSVMFPVQAIDHEDTRYFQSARTSYRGRLGDAFLHTVWRHNDSDRGNITRGPRSFSPGPTPFWWTRALTSSTNSRPISGTGCTSGTEPAVSIAFYPFNEAISITKRYFTSPLSIRS